MKKRERHELIKRIVEEREIQKQEEFVTVLNEMGIEVTQATVSRDIKELQLVKVPTEGGGYHYSLPPKVSFNISRKLSSLLQDAFVSLDIQEKLVLIKTIPGNAVALGSLIDLADYNEIFGTIAGDDTVLAICTGEEEAQKFQRRIISYL